MRQGSGLKYPLEIRERSRDLRAKGWTITEVADELGVSPTSVKNWGWIVAAPTVVQDWDKWRAEVWSPETIRKVLAGEML
jgi:transcriptional regulator with XRE-family HTH domain